MTVNNNLETTKNYRNTIFDQSVNPYRQTKFNRLTSLLAVIDKYVSFWFSYKTHFYRRIQPRFVLGVTEYRTTGIDTGIQYIRSKQT